MNNKVEKSNRKNSRKVNLHKSLRVVLAIALCLAMVLGTSMTAFANGTNTAADSASAKIEEKIWGLTDIIVTVVRIVGVAMAFWGLVQLALSIQGHDPSQRSQAILMIAGGLLIVFAPNILEALGINLGSHTLSD